MNTIEAHRMNLRAPEGRKTYSILITGDVNPTGEDVLNLIRAGKVSSVVEEMMPLFDSSDLRIMQWETVLARNEFSPIAKSGPNLKCDPDTVEFAKALKTDVALLANNHTADYGPDSCLATINVLEKNGIRTVGAGHDEEDAAKPLFLNSCGRRIAILNFCEYEFTQARPGKAGAAVLDPLSNALAVQKAKKEADFVIVALHGGNEHDPYPSPRVTKLCRGLADAGADLVFNCHPHIPQGAEFYHGVPIVYCPGNFFFPKFNTMAYTKSWFTGYVPRFLLDSKGVFAMEFHPYSFTVDKLHTLSVKDQEIFFECFQRLCAPLNDAAKLRAYFEAWTTDHAWILDFACNNPMTRNFEDKENFDRLLGLRNLFTCEAHHEVQSVVLNLIEEHRLEKAKELYSELSAWRDSPWMHEIKYEI